MKLTGSQMIGESLVKEEVEVIFGILGGAILPLYDVLPQYHSYAIYWYATSRERPTPPMAMLEPPARSACALPPPGRERPIW